MTMNIFFAGWCRSPARNSAAGAAVSAPGQIPATSKATNNCPNLDIEHTQKQSFRQVHAK